MVAVERLQRIAEGREAEIFAWEEGRVLRLFRGPRTRQSLEGEMAAMRAARAVAPLVPDVFEIIELEGRPGIVMERVEGTDLITLLGRKPWMIWRAGTILGHVQAQLHEAIAPVELVPLRDRIEQACGLPGMPPEIGAGVRTLLAGLPDGDRLCHGDFHPGNMLMSPRGPVVIDWPNVTRGDPTGDYARSTLMLEMGSPPPGTPALVNILQGIGRKVIAASFRRAYTSARPVDPELLRRWRTVRMADRLAADNIPEERDVLLGMLRKALA
ncbi:MAG: aminoglycoside phosphotransferase family protein [Chloroflexi bacterium]|nr:aminoglycoside phosphotransferase family protein [Chloroflexota bacterium]